MSTLAAVMTGQGTGAISTIQICGEKSESVLRKIFRPTGSKTALFKAGQILVGTISDDSEVIDQVTIGCEGAESYTINCHGNPLIVETIMQLLSRHSVKLISTEQLLLKLLSEENGVNTIAIEAKLSLSRAQTAEGTKIIANQIDGGLNETVAKWLSNINSLPLEEITDEAEQILERSQTTKLLIYGCKAVIVGHPNSGKSTLLNYLAGRQKAIVTDVRGTTRDWVSSTCRLGRICVELIDTAGMDETLAVEGIEKDARQKSIAILEQADLVLLVLDISINVEQRDKKLLEKMSNKKVITVLNKCDLPAKLDVDKLPANMVKISAKSGEGVENLIKQIQQLCGADELDLHAAVCITGRQEKLLNKLKKAKTKDKARTVITELLNGRLRV